MQITVKFQHKYIFILAEITIYLSNILFTELFDTLLLQLHVPRPRNKSQTMAHEYANNVRIFLSGHRSKLHVGIAFVKHASMKIIINHVCCQLTVTRK